MSNTFRQFFFIFQQCSFWRRIRYTAAFVSGVRDILFSIHIRPMSSDLSGWLTTPLQCFDTVGWVIRPVKTVGHITYIVLVSDVKPCSINQSITDVIILKVN